MVVALGEALLVEVGEVQIRLCMLRRTKDEVVGFELLKLVLSDALWIGVRQSMWGRGVVCPCYDST